MHVLLTCVGTKDPFWDLEKKERKGPILTFFEWLEKYGEAYRPIRAIYLLSTAEKPGSYTPTQRRGVKTQEELEKKYEVFHRPLDVLDPTDYQELMPEMWGKIKSVLNEWGDECEYLILTTPGTGQMKAIWVSLYIQKSWLRATLIQVKKPEVEPEEEKRVREVDVSPLRDFVKGKEIERKERFLKDELTPAEREIMEPLVQGLSNLDIAERLYKSEKTIANQLTEIYDKWRNFWGVPDDERVTRYTLIYEFLPLLRRWG